MVRRTYSSTTELVVQTNRGSERRQRRRQVHQVKAKKGNKGGRKAKKKKGGTRSSLGPTKKMEQSNLNDDLVESLDVGGFGNLFQVQRTPDVTHVGFQNYGPQRQSWHDKKSQNGAMAMAGRKYYVLLVVEHDLNPPNLDVKHGWHDHICMTMKGSYSCLSYNTNDREAAPWN